VTGGRYWIKLYLEMLDDPKVAMLSHELFRRWIELLMVAGLWGRDGELPDLAMAAWRLRVNPEELEAVLVELAKSGLVAQIDGLWSIPKFAERQSALSSTDRGQMWRKAARERQTLEGATETNERPTKRSPDRRQIDKTDRGDRGGEKAPARPHPHPAVQVFREETHRWPAKTLQPEIDNIVGRHGEDLALWRRIVHEWVAVGWNPVNIRGMLDCFTRQEIPGTRGKQAEPKGFAAVRAAAAELKP